MLDASVKQTLTNHVKTELTGYAAIMAEAGAKASKALRDHGKRRDPLEKLEAARRLAEAAECLEQEAAAAARAAGRTWTEIAKVYGTSKQAAQQRFRTKG